MKKIVLALLILLLTLPMLTASAQSTTITVTEADLNGALRVQNPARQTVSNVVVDIQEGQVVITATITPRRGNAVTGVATLVPKLVTTGSRTRLEWDISSFTINGQSGSGQYTNARNALSNAYRTAIDAKLGRTFSVQNVTVGGDAITITGSR